MDIDKINNTISLARRMLFRYAPDTEMILGYCNFVLDDSIKTLGLNIEPGKINLKLNPAYVEKLLPQELSVLLYIEAVRLALGHVTSRLYSDKKLSLIASDMICMRMGMRTDIGTKNVIYGIINEHVLRMEEGILNIYSKTYHKAYDYRNVSIEILYRLLQKKSDGNNDSNSQENGDNKEENSDSPVMDYVNDMTRADNWSDDSCLTDELNKCAIDNGNNWGNEDVNGILKTFINMGKKVDFKHLMRLILHRNTPFRKVSTRLKRNRRFGFMFPGYRDEYKPTVLIACDVSSSMKLDYVETIINLILNCGLDVEIEYCWWNTICTIPVKFSKYDRNHGQITMKCGGGTNCDCLFRMLDKRKTRYDSVVIITDFEFDTRHLKMSNKYNSNKIVWIDVNNASERPNFVKKVVNLRDLLI